MNCCGTPATYLQHRTATSDSGVVVVSKVYVCNHCGKKLAKPESYRTVGHKGGSTPNGASARGKKSRAG